MPDAIPTDELRQVIDRRGAVVAVQRKWLVGVGTPESGQSPPSADFVSWPHDRKRPARSLVYWAPLWRRVREEWRDLPTHQLEPSPPNS